MSDDEMEQVECRCYRPGDPGFAALAAQITPLERIKATNWARDIVPFATPQDSRTFRRNETYDK